MTGLREHFDSGPQPAGRDPAPGRLALVQAFANSFWDLGSGGRDAWADDAGWRAWLEARAFSRGAERRCEALRLREALRALAYSNHAGRPPGPALAVLDRFGAHARLRFAPGGPRHEADDPIDLTLAVVAEAMADGRWARLKACPGPHCGWTFFDLSRNRSSHWCSMAVCGNRVKGHAFRERHRAA